MFVGCLNDVLQLFVDHDETKQHEGESHQGCGEDNCERAEPGDEILLAGELVVFLLDGLLTFVVFELQGSQLILSVEGFHGVGPHDVFLVGALHQRRVVCRAGSGNQLLVTFAHLVIVFPVFESARQLVEALVPAVVLPEGVVVYRLIIQQFLGELLAARLVGYVVERAQLELRLRSVAELDVHL